MSFARTTLSNRDKTGVIDITPPASPGVTGVQAKKQGERAIDRDLAHVFAGVRIQGKRRELHPDVAGIHARLFAGKRPGTPLRSDRGRTRYFVDASKLKALSKALKARVGKLASSWLVSANRLGVRAPAWISRHGAGPGSVKVNLRAPRYEIEMSINAGNNAPVAELERRVAYAVRYTEGRLERVIAGTIAANARSAGFRAA